MLGHHLRRLLHAGAQRHADGAPGDQLAHLDLHQLAGLALGLLHLQARLAFGLDEVGEGVMCLAQLLEQLAGNEVDQAVLDRPCRQAHLVPAQQAELAEHLALGQAVVQLAVAPVDLHRAAADVVQLPDRFAIAEDVATGLEIADLDLPGDLVEGFVGQPVEGGEATQVVAYFDQLDLHPGLLAGA
ncbi:hypothetical protein D3C76_1159100 [compost metagenome]